MDLSYDALNILLFLCPGLLVTAVIRILVYRMEIDAFETIVAALLWSLGIYAICAAFGHDSVVRLTEQNIGDVIHRGIMFNPEAISWMIGA